LVGSGNSSIKRLLDLRVMRRSGACITHLASLYCAFASGRIGLSIACATLLLFDKFISREGIRGRRALDWYPVLLCWPLDLGFGCSCIVLCGVICAMTAVAIRSG